MAMEINVIATVGLFPGSTYDGSIPGEGGPPGKLSNDDMAEYLVSVLNVRIINSQFDDKSFLGDESRRRGGQGQHLE